jgi:outer membrane lipoprotein carrier protein
MIKLIIQQIKNLRARHAGPLLCLFVSVFAFAATPAHELDEKLSAYQSLSADFKQSISTEDGGALQTVTGSFVIKRPGKFYWETKQPMQQKIIANNKTVWIYEPDLQQVIERPLNHSIGKTPVLLLTQSALDLTHDFKITLKNLSDHETSFTLSPRLPHQELFQKIILSFRDDQLSQMTLFNSLGQKVNIEFSHVVNNPSPNESIFDFTPPPHVDVIRES